MSLLFGDGWDSPQSQAIMGLSQGLLAGNLGAGIGQANNAVMQGREAQRKAAQDALQAQLLQAQIGNYNSEVAQRAESIKKAQKLQDMIGGIFGSGGMSVPEMSPGAFAPSLGGMGPTLPPSMAAQSQPGSRLASLGIDQIAGLKAAGGPDLMDAFKWVKDPLKMEQGATYQDRATGKREFMPKVDAGIAPDANGFYAPLPGYGDAQASIEGKKTGATEAAKAGLDLVKVIGADGAERYVPRSVVAGQSSPAPAFTPRTTAPTRATSTEADMRNQVRGGMGADPVSIQSELTNARRDLTRVTDPSSKAQLTAYIADLEGQASRVPAQTAQGAQTPQAGGFQASQTTAQQVAAAANKESAVQTAKDVAETRKNIMNAGFVAPTNISKYQQLGKLLESVDGGTLTATGTNLASTMNSLGIKIDKNLPNKEAAAALANQMALELRNPAGGAGMPGAMSDADRNFLAAMVPSASQSAQGRKQLIDAYIAVQKRNQQTSQFARNYEKKYGKLDNDFFDQMQAWSESNPLFKAQ